VGIVSTDSVQSLLKRKPFLPPQVVPPNILEHFRNEYERNSVDNEYLKEMLEVEEIEFDSLKNVMYSRINRILKSKEEEDGSPKTRKKNVVEQ
jgi:hypothetical protein